VGVADERECVSVGVVGGAKVREVVAAFRSWCGVWPEATISEGVHCCFVDIPLANARMHDTTYQAMSEYSEQSGRIR